MTPRPSAATPAVVRNLLRLSLPTVGRRSRRSSSARYRSRTGAALRWWRGSMLLHEKAPGRAAGGGRDQGGTSSAGDRPTTAKPSSAEWTSGTTLSTDSLAHHATSSAWPLARRRAPFSLSASGSSAAWYALATPAATRAASDRSPLIPATRRPATYTSSSAGRPSVPEHTIVTAPSA